MKLLEENVDLSRKFNVEVTERELLVLLAVCARSGGKSAIRKVTDSLIGDITSILELSSQSPWCVAERKLGARIVAGFRSENIDGRT
jgi:hypothetical protein